MASFPGDHLDARNAFFLGLVREHRSGNDVPDRVNAVDVCFEMRVDFDAFPIVELDSDLVGTDTFREGVSTDGDEHLVGVERQLFVALCRRRGGAAILDLHFANLGAEMELHPLRRQHLLQRRR